MAIPAELFRVWTEVEIQPAFGGDPYSTWVNVWYVLHANVAADPIDVAGVFAAWVNAGVTGAYLSPGNVVTRYGGRRVAAGGGDSVLVTGSIPAGGPVQLLPPQAAVLVLGGTLRPRVQTRKWIGGGKQNWIEGDTGYVVSDNAGLTAWWRSSLEAKLLAGQAVQPVVWDAFHEEVHEIQWISVMKGFRTQRRRSLANDEEFQ